MAAVFALRRAWGRNMAWQRVAFAAVGCLEEVCVGNMHAGRDAVQRSALHTDSVESRHLCSSSGVGPSRRMGPWSGGVQGERQRYKFLFERVVTSGTGVQQHESQRMVENEHAGSKVPQGSEQLVDSGARQGEGVSSGVQEGSKDQIGLKAQLIFDTCWKKMEQRFKNRYICPREVVWLNGAPGSGKGTNMPFIMKSRGLSRSIGMSELLSSPEIKSIVDRGELVPDAMVVDALLDAILNPELNDGAGLVIDGFPRTATQVDFVKLLYDRLMERHIKNADTPEEWRSPRPSFKVVILYVDEEESVKRQMKRAEMASLHNQRVLDAGTGDVWNVRVTDVNEALCRRRYQVFKAHYNTILRLKSYFPFSLIDAMGGLQECRNQIVRELRYQSSLDLDEKTYAAIRHLPLAKDLVRVARQRLVFRLDMYCRKHYRLFTDIISLIDTEVIPLLKQCSLAGHAEYRTRHPLLLSSHLAVDMLIDILTDRGFSVAHFVEERVVPRRVDLRSGEISTLTEDVHSFRITFDKENIRDLVSQHSGNYHGENLAIGTTFVPEHMRRGNDVSAIGVGSGEAQAKLQEDLPQMFQEKQGDYMRKGPACFTGQMAKSEDIEEDNDVPQALVNKDKISFVADWDDKPIQSARRERQYGYEMMNERED